LCELIEHRRTGHLSAAFRPLQRKPFYWQGPWLMSWQCLEVLQPQQLLPFHWLRPVLMRWFGRATWRGMALTMAGKYDTVKNHLGYEKGNKMPHGSARFEADLNLPAQPGDRIYLFINNTYQVYTRRGAGWTGGKAEPRLDVGHGFFFFATTPRVWTQVFYVQQ
jgi:hypothetical protein